MPGLGWHSDLSQAPWLWYMGPNSLVMDSEEQQLRRWNFLTKQILHHPGSAKCHQHSQCDPLFLSLLHLGEQNWGAFESAQPFQKQSPNVEASRESDPLHCTVFLDPSDLMPKVLVLFIWTQKRRWAQLLEVSLWFPPLHSGGPSSVSTLRAPGVWPFASSQLLGQPHESEWISSAGHSSELKIT